MTRRCQREGCTEPATVGRDGRLLWCDEHAPERLPADPHRHDGTV